MFETIDRLMVAGLGAFNMTRERAQKLFDDAVRRGQEERSNQEKFIQDLMDGAKEARHNLESAVAKEIRQVMAGLNIPTREDLERIEAKLDQLLAHRKAGSK